jgi:hypothetical protein
MNTIGFWTIVSWVGVAIMTALNIFIFVKLKSASEQMLKMAFPNAKNMGEAMAQAQKMMGSFGGQGGKGGSSDARLKAAMQMLSQQNRNRR